MLHSKGHHELRQTVQPARGKSAGAAGKLIRLPWEFVQQVERSKKLGDSVTASSTILYPSSKILNGQNDPSLIRIGERGHILGELFVFGHGGRITIGDDCFLGENSRIWSAHSIEIGDRVLISHDANIHDTIAHPLSARARHEQTMEIFRRGHPRVLEMPAEPVVLEDDCWIGFGATVLKGVRIGRGAVVGGRAVVTKDVEPFAIVVGNPARVVGRASK